MEGGGQRNAIGLDNTGKRGIAERDKPLIRLINHFFFLTPPNINATKRVFHVFLKLFARIKLREW